MHQEMCKAVQFANNKTYIAKTYDEFKEYLKQGGYIKMSVNKMKPKKLKDGLQCWQEWLRKPLITENCPVTNQKATQTILFTRAY